MSETQMRDYHASGSCMRRVFTTVLCLFLHTIFQKTDAARITKLHKQMFHNEFCKAVY